MAAFPISVFGDEGGIQTLPYADAYLRSEGRIVFHFGEGIKNADITAEIIREKPEVKVPVEVYGGHFVEDELFLYINFEEYGPFDQNHLDRGEVGSFILFKMRQRGE
jgi:hypothetical protein